MIQIVSRNYTEWRHFGEVLERITSFCNTYESDAQPQMLEDIIVAHYVNRDDKMLLLACIVDDVVVAHLLATLDVWCGARYATIVQYEADKGKMSSTDRAEGYKMLEAWAQSHSADLQILARNPKMAKLFARYHGFSPLRVLMRKRVI